VPLSFVVLVWGVRWPAGPGPRSRLRLGLMAIVGFDGGPALHHLPAPTLSIFALNVSIAMGLALAIRLHVG